MNIYFGHITVKYLDYHIITYWTVHNKEKLYYADIYYRYEM